MNALSNETKVVEKIREILILIAKRDDSALHELHCVTFADFKWLWDTVLGNPQGMIFVIPPRNFMEFAAIDDTPEFEWKIDSSAYERCEMRVPLWTRDGRTDYELYMKLYSKEYYCINHFRIHVVMIRIP